MIKSALITGVSRGIGKKLAKTLMKNGYEVIGVSRSIPDFKMSKHIKADLLNKKDREKILKIIEAEKISVDILVNNAGVGLYESWEKMKLSELKEQFELNFFVLVHLTQQFIPQLKKNKGVIVNLSSVAGKTYIPNMGAYCASKHAVEVFSATLRIELKKYGISVINIAPGRIKTGFGIRAMGTKKTPQTPFRASSDILAKKILKAIEKRKREMIFPKWYKLFIQFSKKFTKLYEKISIKKWEK